MDSPNAQEVRSASARSASSPRRDNGEGNTLAAGRITGAFAAGQVSRSWMPDRVATFGSGAQSFGASLGLDVGTNLFVEFWPHKP